MSIEENKHINLAIDYFQKAQHELYGKNFSQAVQYIHEYRMNIDYSMFYSIDNRIIKKPDLSIIIVAYNTNEDFVDCIKSVLKGTVKNIEIIVVDNGKNDAVLPIIENLPVLYLKMPMNVIPSEGRNVGVSYAQGQICAFLDDDGLAPPTYAESILTAFRNPQVIALRGKVLPKNPHAFKRAGPHYDLGDSVIPWFINTEGCSAWRKKEYMEEGGMDPLLFGHEGIDLTVRIVKKYGLRRTFYFPDTYIFHDFAVSSDKNAIKTERHKIMDEYLQWKFPDVWHMMGSFQRLKAFSR